MRPKTLTWIATISTVLLLTPACSNVSDPESSEKSPRSQPSEAPTKDTLKSRPQVMQAEIIDTDFRPRRTAIEAGTEVIWTQVGDQPHSVSAADGSFDSSPSCGPLAVEKCLGMDDAFSFTFYDPGTYRYYCKVHGLPDGTGMVGEVVVK